MTLYNSGRELAERAWVVVRTIRVRLAIWYTFVLGIILLGFGLFLFASLSHNLYAQVDATLSAESKETLSFITVHNRHPDITRRQYLPADTVFLLYDRSGKRVLDSDTGSQFPRSLAASLVHPPSTRTVLATVRYREEDRWRVITTPVYKEGRQIGVLQLARSLSDVEDATEQLLKLMSLTIPFLTLLALGGGIFLAGKALTPIDRITRTAERIGAEDLSRRINLPPSPDEVGRLATTFDSMIDRLDRAFKRQRQFTADASHELRTPLTLLVNQADVTLERKRNQDEYEQAIRDMRKDALRMTRLLGDLLTLARADTGSEVFDMEKIRLDELVEDVTDSMSLLAEDRSILLEINPSTHVSVIGDRMRLTQLLVNLIENGIRYTPPGGIVTVSISDRDKWAEIRVLDTGCGIPEEHLPYIFERFYRVDNSRSRSEGSTGLGLSICRWIATAHGGEISARNRPGEGTEFTVRLPQTAESPANLHTMAQSP